MESNPATSVGYESILNMSWGGGSYPAYDVRCEVASAGDGGSGGAGAGAGSAASAASPAAGTSGAGAAAAAADGGGSGSGTDGGGSASPANGSTPGGSPTPTTNADGSPGSGQAANPNDENIRQLRQGYEQYSKLGKPEQVAAHVQRVQGMWNEGARLAQQLGYTPESFRDAFNDDPVDTLGRLRGEYHEANPGAKVAAESARIAREEAARAVQPITQQLNRQQTDAALNRYEAEFNRLHSDASIGLGPNCPQEVTDFVREMVDNMIPDSALLAIKQSGKVSEIQQVYAKAKTRVLAMFNAYSKHTANSGGGPTAAATGAGNTSTIPGKPVATKAQSDPYAGLRLDDIINDPTVLPGVKAGKY